MIAASPAEEGTTMPEHTATTNGRQPTTETIDPDGVLATSAAPNGAAPNGAAPTRATAGPAAELLADTTPDPAPGAPSVTTGGVTEAWSAIVHDVRSLTIELAEVCISVARQLSRPTLPVTSLPSFPAVSVPSIPSLPTPGLPRLQNGWSRAQDALAREVKSRLDRVDEPPGHPHGGRSADWRSPADLLDDLLDAGATADPEAGRTELYRALLLQLVPDEAGLLASLAEGTVYPLVHVQARSRTVLANASTLGEVARLAVPEAAGTYITRLLALGLAVEAPEDQSLAAQYDLLIGGSRVRAAEELAREDSRLGSRTLRRTLVISALGRSLWTACRPEPLVATA
jgi:hypothetical protein